MSKGLLEQAPARPRMRPHGGRIALAVFVGALLVYLSNGRSMASADTVGTALTPVAIALDGSIWLDRFAPMWGLEDGSQLARRVETGAAVPYAARPAGEHLVSAYPLAPALLAAPLYLLPAALLRLDDRPWADAVWFAGVMEMVVAALYAALGVAAFFLLADGLGPRRDALVLTIVFALGTPQWTTSSQALWQHGPGLLFVLLALLGIQERRPLGAGVAAALAVAVRPLNLLFWAAAVTVLAFRERRRAALFALPGVIVGAALAIYNVEVLGSVTGSYAYANEGELWSGNPLVNLPALLFSARRGLFVYVPVAAFGLWSLLRARDWDGPVPVIAALFAGSQLAVLAFWWTWDGGWSYGPRLLGEVAAMLLVLCIPVMPEVMARPATRWAFLGLAAVSAAVQAYGAYFYVMGST